MYKSRAGAVHICGLLPVRKTRVLGEYVQNLPGTCTYISVQVASLKNRHRARRSRQ